MSETAGTAEQVLAALTPGMRMKTLFDAAKAATWIAPDELTDAVDWMRRELGMGEGGTADE